MSINIIKNTILDLNKLREDTVSKQNIEMVLLKQRQFKEQTLLEYEHNVQRFHFDQMIHKYEKALKNITSKQQKLKTSPSSISNKINSKQEQAENNIDLNKIEIVIDKNEKPNTNVNHKKHKSHNKIRNFFKFFKF